MRSAFLWFLFSLITSVSFPFAADPTEPAEGADVQAWIKSWPSINPYLNINGQEIAVNSENPIVTVVDLSQRTQGNNVHTFIMQGLTIIGNGLTTRQL